MLMPNSSRGKITKRKHMNPGKKPKNSSENSVTSGLPSTPCDLTRLHKVLLAREITQDEAIARIEAQFADPAKDLYATIVMAAAQINEEIRNRTLNAEDPYTKAILRLLESGDKVVKSVRQAKLEAYPQEFSVPVVDGPIGDS